MTQRRIAVRGIIVREGKLLCVKLHNYQGKATDDNEDYWCTPGGGVDIGEPLTLALERELVEELGIKPVVGALLYIQQFEHKDTEHIEFFFHITNHDDYLTIDLESTSHGAVEIEKVDFLDTAHSRILPEFLTRVDLESDITKGMTNVFNYIKA